MSSQRQIFLQKRTIEREIERTIAERWTLQRGQCSPAAYAQALDVLLQEQPHLYRLYSQLVTAEQRAPGQPRDERAGRLLKQIHRQDGLDRMCQIHNRAGQLLEQGHCRDWLEALEHASAEDP